MIQLEAISKIYETGSGKRVNGLRNIDLRIGRGEFVVIKGPSGAGKSTLMNILGLLDTPSAGRYFLNGEEVSGRSIDDMAQKRNTEIGFVFQAFHLLPKTTAAENVELPLLYSIRTDSEGLALEALRMVGLADRADHFPGELSGGQQQRVAIARALVNDPALILADEPTGNLDESSAKEIMALFRELNRKGKTLVIISHDSNIAAGAERVLTIDAAAIIADEGGKQGRP